MSISFVAPDNASTQSRIGQRWLVAAVSYGMIVMFPTAFWLGVLELLVMALDFSYGSIGRTIAALVLVGFLTVVWSIVRGLGSETTRAAA